MSNNGLAAIIAALAVDGDPDDALIKYYGALRDRGFQEYTDPLYPNVILFRNDNQVLGYVTKRRGSTEEATQEAAALEHLARLVDLKLGPPHYLPLVHVGNIVLSPFVGPEVYMIEHQLSEKLSRYDTQNVQEKEDLICFRRALVLRQLDVLARAVVTPYIPKDERGRDIVSNSDILTYYKDNMRTVFSHAQGTNSLKDDPLEACLDFLVNHFLIDTSETRVRYVDTYSRNCCFRVETDAPNQLLRVTLDDILRARSAFHQRHSDTPSFQRDLRFLRYRLVQVDAHRNEKIALAGEMEANILQAPRLLDGQVPFTRTEQINAMCRFFLAQEFERARAAGKSSDILFDVMGEMEKTARGTYSWRDLAKVLTLDEGLKEHYEAMSLYKALRWLGYVQEYIPKYTTATKTEIRKQRLGLYKKDLIVYKQVALQAVHGLMETLYAALDSSHSGSGKNIILGSDGNTQRKLYSVDKLSGRGFIFYTGKIRHPKPITDSNRYAFHIKQLDAHAETDSQKTYAGLLKLAYLESLIHRL